jgi:hypothetical protein
MRKLYFLNTVALLLSQISWGDIPLPPSPFDGRCRCSITCDSAFLSNSPTQREQARAKYEIRFRTSYSTGTYEGDRICKAASEIDVDLEIWPTGKISPKEAVSQFCKRGGPETGYCSNETLCDPSHVTCTSVLR